MKPGFLNEVTTQSDSLESFKKEEFVKVTAKKKPILVIVSIVVLSSLGLWFFFNQKTEVPDFVHWTLADVSAWTQSHDIQLVYQGVYSAESVDTVIAQDIQAGTQVSSNSVISVQVSQGLDPNEVIVLPAFDATWDKTDLLKWLSDNELDSYRFELATDDDLQPNAFIALSSVEPMTRSSEFVFIINQSAAATLIMPDLSTSTLADIEAWAQASNIKLTVNSVFSDTVPSDKFVSQSILPDAVIESGSELTVSFSKGEAILIADFKTMDAAEAKTWASLNNVTLTIETQYSSVKAGSLISQSLKAQTAVEAKTAVTVIYSLGNTVSIGSYANASLTSLQSFIDAQNELGAQLSLSVSTQYSNTVALNRIIAVSVSDEPITTGSTLEVIVSLGALVKVPDFTILVTGDYLTTYNAILNAAKSANVTLRINTINDPLIDEANMTLTQSIASGTLCSSADIIDLTLTY